MLSHIAQNKYKRTNQRPNSDFHKEEIVCGLLYAKERGRTKRLEIELIGHHSPRILLAVVRHAPVYVAEIASLAPQGRLPGSPVAVLHLQLRPCLSLQKEIISAVSVWAIFQVVAFIHAKS